jgi:hypothetical protein
MAVALLDNYLIPHVSGCFLRGGDPGMIIGEQRGPVPPLRIGRNRVLLMKRCQLFEFSDLSYWPMLLRTYALDYLRAVADRYHPISPKIEVLLRAMRAGNTDQILDLCSGVGGPWPHLGPEIVRQRNKPIRLLFSDKYPPLDADSRPTGIAGASYVQQSVDARQVPRELVGLRTLLNSFHHFRPDEARQVLQDAVSTGQPIAIFEMLERSWSYFAFMLLTPLLVMLLTPKLRPFRLSRILLTFVIPVVPLCMLWDSAVSVLRCYTAEELLGMAAGLEGVPYTWDAGTYRLGALPVTYLVGYPVTRDVCP